MIQALAKIFGTKHQRELKRLQPIVTHINQLEPSIQRLSDAELMQKTVDFRSQLTQMQAQKVSLQDALNRLLPEAFAVVREASRRTVGMRPYDVQLIGGMVLHEGSIAEMKTGEGKTLVATMPLYLNALAGKGVHLVTVNDYLATRDADWMGKIYRFLGMSVGVIVHDLDNAARKKAYAADITYGTNNEFGFDYLRDNMKYDLKDYVQREHFFAIVDEVDSILIDEARTPLIISGPTDQNPQRYKQIDRLIRQFLQEEKKLGTDPTQDPKEGDNPGRYYHVDLEHKSVTMTEEGVALIEKLSGIDNLYTPENIESLHHVQQALRAHTLYHSDVEYVVQNDEVVIVDEFTGRFMPGRRWSDGLHQAVEAKENVTVENENQTLASITFQNYFKMYEKLAGMTGTAETEAAEFYQIYQLDVMVIPTNKSIIRQDEPDLVFKREAEKFKAIAEKIKELHEQQAPVLVGTTSVEKSERIEKALIRQGITKKKIHVLNAKQHHREADIIAQAGQSGAITIATNMAGRGTDIVLGGNPEHLAWQMLIDRGFSRQDLKAEQFIRAIMMGQSERAVAMIAEDERLAPELIDQIQTHITLCRQDQAKVVAAGGLHIIGTERHESRRVDNQLRGRAGRQGDPGWSQFYLSLEDELIHIFSGDRILTWMDRFGMQEDEAIQHPWLSKTIAGAQQKVEARNFEIRKNVLEYDDVMNQQRRVVYQERRTMLAGEGLEIRLTQLQAQVAAQLAGTFAPPKTFPENWDWTGLDEALTELGITTFAVTDDERHGLDGKELEIRLLEQLQKQYETKKTHFGEVMTHQVLQFIMLQSLDQLWKDHLLAMDHLREGVGLRGYGQKDPKREYAMEGFEMFQQMLDLFAQDVLRKINRVEVTDQAGTKLNLTIAKQTPEKLHFEHQTQATYGVTAQPQAAGQSAENMGSSTMSPSGMVSKHQPIIRDEPKVGRNDLCPCGSGKKYKKCHYPEYGS